MWPVLRLDYTHRHRAALGAFAAVVVTSGNRWELTVADAAAVSCTEEEGRHTCTWHATRAAWAQIAPCDAPAAVDGKSGWK
jgi:hypothetical protein